jgi:hypothetical protein
LLQGSPFTLIELRRALARPVTMASALDVMRLDHRWGAVANSAAAGRLADLAQAPRLALEGPFWFAAGAVGRAVSG